MRQANITTEKPPVWEMLAKRFGTEWKDICVTYGGVIYSPNPVEDDVLAHELVHVKQQFGQDADTFMHRYLDDDKFRSRCEIEAYREQYGYWKKHIKNKTEILKALNRMADELSGPMYGSCITRAEAFKQIRNGR